MPLRTVTVRLVLVLAAIVLVACGRPSRGGEQNLSAEVLFAVENNVLPPTSFTVYVLNENGARQLLGTISPSATQVMRYRPVSSATRVRLLAHATASNQLLSPVFTLTHTGAVSWDMRHNMLSFADRE